MTVIDQLEQMVAQEIIESLRSGIPPKRYASAYSAGNEGFLKDVRKRHLEGPSTRGKIRFVSGSWGSGKTHILRLLREEAFDANCLVSSVDLTVNETPFNKFEEVFYRIVEKIGSPAMYRRGELDKHAAPFELVLRETLFNGWAGPTDVVTQERFQEAKEKLFATDGIDIDFRRMIARYWETFLPQGGDPSALEDVRGRTLQWFKGEGTLGSYRSQFGVQKVVNRSNARLMLQSLSRFATHAGFQGIVILLDEAEMSYSVMRKSNLKQAHNNLLHLINSIDESEGLFLVYAATPDFFMDDRYGLTTYGALAQRIGRPEERPPKAVDRVWNLDAIETSLEDYLTAASKIRQIFLSANPEVGTKFINETALRTFVTEIIRVHPEFSHVSTWRVVVTATVGVLDSSEQGEEPGSPKEVHADIMDRLREK